MSTNSLIQAEREKFCSPHENVVYMKNDVNPTVGCAFGCGDVGILHNIALVFKCKAVEDSEYQKMLDRFNVVVRTMRRATHWDWVKLDHIKPILQMLTMINEDIDLFISMFRAFSEFILEESEKGVESGSMSEGNYLDFAKGIKVPYDYITGKDFKSWVKTRAIFYKSLNGATPNIELKHLPNLNEHDGKIIVITAF